MSSEKIIALYERLSREDENLGESYSIQNQKKLLEDFCREKGWTRFRHFTDDGISGTTFERPSFKEMISLVEDGEVEVYDALNKYGELCPQQEKALEELGFELPDPTKKRSRFNNRKMCFDAECRKLFLDIGQKNGVELEYEPEYGGASYLEKQDYIIENQQKRIAKMQAALDDITLKVLDMENMVEQIADDAYEKACEVVADTVAEHTRAEDIAELRSYKKWLTSDERKTPKDKRDFVGKCLDNLEARFRKMAQAVAKKVLGALQSPQIKEQKKEEIKERARVSVRERLAEHQKQVEMEKQRKAELPKVKKQKTEELG